MMNTLKNLRRVYKYGRSYRINLLWEVIGSIIAIIAGIILPILHAKQIVYLTGNVWVELIYMSIIILIVGIINQSRKVLIRKNTQRFTVGVTEKMQQELGTEILKITQTDLDNNSTGTFIKRMTSDVDELANMFTTGMGRLVGVVSSVGTFIAIFFINKTIFLYYVFTSLTLTILHLIKSKKYNKKDKEKRLEQEHVTSLVSELIRGARDVKMLNASSSFIKVLNQSIKNKNKKHIEMRNIDIDYNLIIDCLKEMFEFVLIILCISLVKKNILSVAMTITLYSYRTRVMTNLMENISLLLEEVNGFNLSFERVFSILDNKTFTKEKFGSKHLTKINGDFEFRNVSFGYEDKKFVLNSINFKVKANTTVGFVGKSGSGKTTIFSLMCKMYDTKSGEILIDGVNINELDSDSIRGNITIIGQSPYIFNMSIIDNMRLVKDDVTLDEVRKACQLACLADYIETLPNKYDTFIGEGGVLLSGGQRQRMAIARALIQKTEIILFDEATSALDNETQSKIQEAINNLKREYTIMIIAHRFSTILNCDEIFFIDNGKILDHGTHDELLKRCEEYKKLYEAEIKKNEL